MNEAYYFEFDESKNILLQRDRGISFERIIAIIADGKLLRVLEHHDRRKYPHQYIYEVDVEGYVYLVPVVIDGSKIFLKTIYPSRKATKRRKDED